MASGPYRKGSKWIIRFKEGGRQRSSSFDSEAAALVGKATILDPSVLNGHRPVRKAKKRSSRPPGSLLSEQQVSRVLDAAREFSEARWALLHMLQRYGIRPVSYCAATVENFVDTEFPFLTGLRNKNGSCHWHPLFPEDAELMRRLVAGRRPKAPLFVGPKGEGWKIHYNNQHPKGCALALCQWYHASIATRAGLSVSSGQAGIYRLKHYAITRMKQGAAPWACPLTSADISAITGITTKSVIDNNYTETNTLRLVQLTRETSR